MSFSRTIDEKIPRALVTLINGDSDFAAFYGGRVRYLPPTVDPDLISLPDCIVQNVPERDAFNRNTGGFAHPTVTVRIAMFEQDRVGPYDDGEDPETNIINRIVALERLLELGQDVSGDGNDLGKLLDPDAAPNLPPSARILNTGAPRYVRQARLRVDISKEQDRSCIAVVFPLLVTYETRQNRLTRGSA